MNLFGSLTWMGAVALLAALGGRAGGERGAALASLLPLAFLAVACLRSWRRQRAAAQRDPSPATDCARWQLSKTEALVETWESRDVRFAAGVAVVLGWPALVALVVRGFAGMPLTLAWRWRMLLVLALISPALLGIARVVLGAVSAIRHRERSIEWAGSGIVIRTPSVQWRAPRRSLSARTWRGVVVVTDREAGRVVAVPRDVAAGAGLI